MIDRVHRRDFSRRMAALFPVAGSAGRAFAASSMPTNEVISHSAESIHQEVVFKASPQRVYQALVDAKQFDKVVQLSGVMTSGMLPAGATKPTEISSKVGGPFALFGGYITGRQIELVPNERIVQAWRDGGWDPGIYSIARFKLVDQSQATKLIFDHTGFPVGTAQSLADGWNKHYWASLEKYLT